MFQMKKGSHVPTQKGHRTGQTHCEKRSQLRPDPGCSDSEFWSLSISCHCPGVALSVLLHPKNQDYVQIHTCDKKHLDTQVPAEQVTLKGQ